MEKAHYALKLAQILNTFIAKTIDTIHLIVQTSLVLNLKNNSRSRVFLFIKLKSRKDHLYFLVKSNCSLTKLNISNLVNLRFLWFTR